MTTAHRPTWAPAKGKEHQGGARLFGPSAKHSKLDANGFMTLKTRHESQSGADALLARDLRAELEEKERRAKGKGAIAGADVKETIAALGSGASDDGGRFRTRAEDADDDASASGSDDESDGEDLMNDMERCGSDASDARRARARTGTGRGFEYLNFELSLARGRRESGEDARRAARGARRDGGDGVSVGSRD